MKYLVKSENTDFIKKYVSNMLYKMGIKDIPEIETSFESGIEIEKPIIHKQSDGETHMMYKSYLMLHLLSDEDKDVEAVCFAIEIIEDMERHDYPIIEKGIYQGAFKKI